LQLSQQNKREIQTVNTPQELDAALIAAGNQPVLLEFSAKWCLSCQVMEERVFPQESVEKALEPFVQLRVDLTHATPEKEAIMKKWDVIAPPVIIFIQRKKELPDTRLVGEVNAKELVVTAYETTKR
jgi:thioredoxin:protein disulfide reductase